MKVTIKKVEPNYNTTVTIIEVSAVDVKELVSAVYDAILEKTPEVVKLTKQAMEALDD